MFFELSIITLHPFIILLAGDIIMTELINPTKVAYTRKIIPTFVLLKFSSI